MSEPMTHLLAALIAEKANDARDVFDGTCDTAKQSVDYFEQLLLAALEAARPLGVKVKPLVWEDRGGAVHPQFKAVTGFGTYYIERNKGGLFDWWTPALRGKVEVKTLDAAKAAAQADYEARILAALEAVTEKRECLHPFCGERCGEENPGVSAGGHAARASGTALWKPELTLQRR